MTKRIGKYEVIKKLASGGFGVTYLAIDTTGCINSPCVIKQYHPLQKFDSDLDADMKRRFKKEAEILRNLSQSCKQIPKLLDEFSEGDELYIVQEFIEGKTLNNKVRDEGKFPEKEAKRILVSLLSALHYIHSKNIIHRDISPDNIIIRDYDQKPILIDFGAVKEVVTTVLDSKGFPLNLTIAIGKRNYAPPEQFLDTGLGEPKFQSDIYSLALTIIFLITGKNLSEFSRNELKEIKWREYAPNISNKLKDVLDKAIMWDYANRYASANDMIEALYATVIYVQYEELTTVVLTKKKEERDKIQREIDRRLQEAKKIVRDYFEYLERKAEEERKIKEKEDAKYKDGVRRGRRQRELAKLNEEAIKELEAEILRKEQLNKNEKTDSQNSNFDFSGFKFETDTKTPKNERFRDIFSDLFGGESIEPKKNSNVSSTPKKKNHNKKLLTSSNPIRKKFEDFESNHPNIYFPLTLILICVGFTIIIFILVKIITALGF